jgi:hypothetical protein
MEIAGASAFRHTGFARNCRRDGLPRGGHDSDHHPHLCRCRRLPGKGRDLPRRDPAWRVGQRRRGQIHPHSAGSADRTHCRRRRHGCRRQLDCGTRWSRRCRRHRGHSAGEPLRQGGRRGDRAERQALLGTVDRHGARGTEFDDGSAFVRRNHRPPSPRDRSNFLSALDQTIRRIQRRAAEQAAAGPR